MKFGSITITVHRERPTRGDLSPAEKLDALKEMGFVAMWDDHQYDCPSLHSSGNLCICVPPGTSWYAPKDVKEFMHETWDELRAKARARRTA